MGAGGPKGKGIGSKLANKSTGRKVRIELGCRWGGVVADWNPVQTGTLPSCQL